MQVFTDINSQDVTKLLCSGAIGVIRTDTLYGLVCRAADQVAVESIYAIKGRDDTKSPIVLVSNINQLFDRPSAEERVVIESVWPGPVSVIIHSTQAPE
jgi:tRNA A37 threonylcarbamoyladenosine synthetase subunit TsaC/SUA5/YrdC